MYAEGHNSSRCDLTPPRGSRSFGLGRPGSRCWRSVDRLLGRSRYKELAAHDNGVDVSCCSLKRRSSPAGRRNQREREKGPARPKGWMLFPLFRHAPAFAPPPPVSRPARGLFPAFPRHGTLIPPAMHCLSLTDTCSRISHGGILLFDPESLASGSKSKSALRFLSVIR